MSRTRAAVVGVGYLGRFHAMKYREIPEVDLVGVVDKQPERARHVAQEVGTECLERLEDLFGRVDVATVAVPTTDHHGVAMALLKRGIHVLVEKPIAAHLEQAQEMVEAARQRGVVLQVGHLERFNPTISALRGRLRDPLFLEIHRISPFPSRGADVDVVLDLMIHDIDLLLDFLKAEITQIDAVGVPVLTPNYDIVNARFRFSDGCVANVTASRVSAKSLRKIRVFQSDAYLSVDCAKREIVEYRRVPAELNGGTPRIVGGRLEVEERDTLLEEVRAFVHAVRSGGRPVVDGETGVRCLRVALRVISIIEETFPEGLRQLLGGKGGHG